MRAGSTQGTTGPADDPSSRGPLRIAFFTDSFPPTHDGVANVTEAIAVGLRQQGHEITIFTVRPLGLPGAETRPDGIRIHRHLSLAAPRYPQYRVAAFPYLPVVSPSCRRRFDVVHIHTTGFVGLSGWLTARRWGLPSVGTYHTHLKDMLRGAAHSRGGERFLRAWGQLALDLCRICDLATAPTQAAIEALTHGARGEFRRPPVVVENGVDTDRFLPGVTRPDWGRTWRMGLAPRVLFLGRMTQDKGVHRFLDALEGWDPGTPFVGIVGGEGPRTAETVRRLRDRSRFRHPVLYVGPVSEQEKAALFSQSSIFVLPSLSDTSSIALLEAMSSGLACVLTSSHE
ncbi:MAG: glycosyltransferase [Thermoplasmata archaeon]